MHPAGTNWAGNHVYGARGLHRPARLEELRALVAGAPQIHVLGSRHSFNAIADAAELVTLDALPAEIEIDRESSTVSCSAAVRYGALAERLTAEGLALANLASLPHISVGGAIATATRGSGDAVGNLATAVAGLELVTSAGDVVSVRRGDPDLDGLVVGLGAAGAVTRVTLDVEPAFDVRQHVFEALSWEALGAHLDAITGAGYSVSLFTRWGEDVEQVWVKTRTTQDAPAELFGARPATREHHPLDGLDPVNCTPQLGVAGPWAQRLPHFRMDFQPSSGDELQSEYHVARSHAPAAIAALRGLGDVLRPVLQISELRTVAADELWLSPQYGQDTIGVHFTWIPDQPAVERVLLDVEAALAPLAARPHWGKLFRLGSAPLAASYPRLPDFRALLDRYDPRGAFRTAWLDERIG